MHTRRQFLTLAAGAGGAALGLGTLEWTARAAQSTPAAIAGLRVSITAREYSFDAPATVPAGLVDITLENTGTLLHMAQIGRLNDGVSFDQFKTVLETKPQGSALPLFKFRGGPNNVPPGASQEVINRLDAGHYVLVCFVIDPDGVPHYMKGMLSHFEVSGTAASGSEPASDLTVSMKDFAYAMPDQIPAGRLVWKVVNNGPQPHELEIDKLAPGVTEAQAIAAYTAKTTPGKNATPMTMPAATPAGPPPFRPTGGMGTLAPGITGWLVTDLQPGNYLTLCRVPDPKTHKLHYMEGMVTTFTVAAS